MEKNTPKNLFKGVRCTTLTICSIVLPAKNTIAPIAKKIIVNEIIDKYSEFQEKVVFKYAAIKSEK